MWPLQWCTLKWKHMKADATTWKLCLLLECVVPCGSLTHPFKPNGLGVLSNLIPLKMSPCPSWRGVFACRSGRAVEGRAQVERQRRERWRCHYCEEVGRARTWHGGGGLPLLEVLRRFCLSWGVLWSPLVERLPPCPRPHLQFQVGRFSYLHFTRNVGLAAVLYQKKMFPVANRSCIQKPVLISQFWVSLFFQKKRFDALRFVPLVKF